MEEQMVWLRAAQKGDKASFGHLVTAHQDRLLRVAWGILGNRHDAEDVVQETFVKAYLALDQLKELKAFGGWLLRIVVNQSISRKKKPERLWLELDKAEGRHHDMEGPGRRLEEAEEKKQLAVAMSQLSPSHRAVLILREQELLSYEEISDVLGLPVGTVRSRLSYGRQKLREIFLALETQGLEGKGI